MKRLRPRSGQGRLHAALRALRGAGEPDYSIQEIYHSMHNYYFNRTVELVPLSRWDGKPTRVQIQLGPKADPTCCFKDRAAWLLEALGGQWTGRHGYTLAPAKAAAFATLYEAGWNGEVPFFPVKGEKPHFTRQGDERKYTLKEALALCTKRTE